MRDVPALAVLPIDRHADAIAQALDQRGCAVILAPPGAGKTTRVPDMVARAVNGPVVVLEPRRLAARLAATWLAQQRGERVGETVGYEVRFDRKCSARTAIRFVTEGVFRRQLVANPELPDVGAVIIDEFHERHVDTDVVLALVQRLRQSTRPDLKLVVMSATIDPQPISEFLGGAAVIDVAVRAHAIDVHYRPGQREWPLEKKVSNAVREFLRSETDGGCLVFLPGAAEIRRCHSRLAEVVGERARLCVLHGDMPADEQESVVSGGDRRKIILATNVAETSITIDGVVAVIDSGLARVASHSPWSGVGALQVQSISRASATQRAGRAGRTQPGTCIRLFTEHDFSTWREFDTPEIARADLAQITLELAVAGIGMGDLRWFESPPAAAVDRATLLLELLGCLEAGMPTAVGKRVASLPAHPRQGRVVVEAASRGVAAAGCVAASLMAERELSLERRRGEPAAHSSRSDVADDVDLYFQHRGRSAGELRRAGIDPGAFFAVERGSRQLARAVGCGLESDDYDLDALLISILAGFPDRVAWRRSPGLGPLLLSSGSQVTLSRSSAVHDGHPVVAVDAEERGRGAKRTTLVRSASAIDSDWLLELFLDRVVDEIIYEWNSKAERVERVSRMTYGSLTLEEKRSVDRGSLDLERARDLVIEAARAAPQSRFFDEAELECWRQRVALAMRVREGQGMVFPGAEELARLLLRASDGVVSFAELETHYSMEALRYSMPAQAVQAVDELAPRHVAIAGRARVQVHYEPDRPPWIESRLQDFFGMAEGPTVGGGTIPVVLHLLAPNRRAVQVTSDLSGFWRRHYPAIRKQLCRRYPRHRWPDDPSPGMS